MATLEQIKNIRALRRKGWRPYSIANELDLPLSEVTKAIRILRKNKPKRKPKQSRLRPEKVLKIRDEYHLMLENGYTKKYTCEELGRWYRLKPERILNIGNGITYKNIKPELEPLLE